MTGCVVKGCQHLVLGWHILRCQARQTLSSIYLFCTPSPNPPAFSENINTSNYSNVPGRKDTNWDINNKHSVSNRNEGLELKQWRNGNLVIYGDHNIIVFWNLIEDTNDKMKGLETR